MLSFNQMKIYIINIYKYTAGQIWPLCLSLTVIWGGEILVSGVGSEDLVDSDHIHIKICQLS